MSYTFSATGLPPGLALVGNTVTGTPTAAGTYTVTFSVSDGVSSVSEVVDVTIAPADVPLPFWQLILQAESGCYAGESVSVRTTALAETGAVWGDSVFVVPTVALEAGAAWGDSVVDASNALLSAPYQECYTSGKSSYCVERGTYTWRSDTTPVNTGSEVTFIQCDGSTITLTAEYGGSLSTSGGTTDTGPCS